MALAWMMYLLIVSALAAGAALAAEAALRLYRRPARWAWAIALLVSVGLPALAFLLPRAFAGGTPSLGGGVALPALVVGGTGTLETIAADPAAWEWVARIEPLVAAFWALSTCVAAALVGVSALRLRRERREWCRESVEGEPVLLSEDRGPAVVGLFSGSVVLPRWIAELEEDALCAVLLHEREHLRAGDHRLFAVAIAAVLVAPWNPVLWWQLRRLRLAVECDCDARVLARGVSLATYGASLLRVGTRLSRATWGMAAFAEPRSHLERRVEMMTRKPSRLRSPKAIASAVASAGLLFLACETPVVRVSADASLGETAPAPTRAGPGEPGDPSAGPTSLPYDTPPRLENGPEVQAALGEAYPPALRDAGVGGRVILWMHVDEDGRVAETVVKESSGHPELDEAARGVAATMAFTPARNEGSPTEVWVAQTITFDPGFTAREALGYWDRPPEERPLLVIDGVIRSDDPTLAEIDELDIERVEIIRGQAARGLYGSRARNGVVEITTKGGVERR